MTATFIGLNVNLSLYTRMYRLLLIQTLHDQIGPPIQSKLRTFCHEEDEFPNPLDRIVSLLLLEFHHSLPCNQFHEVSDFKSLKC